MLKNRLKDKILEPSDTIKKIRGKARLYLIFWVSLLVVSGLVYWSSSFTVVDLPTLAVIAKSSPISFELTMNWSPSNEGAFSTFDSSVFSSMSGFVWAGVKFASIIMIITGFASLIFRRNIMVLCISLITAGMLNFAPFLYDVDSENSGSSVSASVAEKIDFGDYVKSGDLKGFLQGIEKYSTRGGFILNSVIESKEVNQDDARNLLDVFSKNDAQKVSVGFAETLANASSNGDTSLNNSASIASALSAYVLSSVEQDDSEPVVDNRTGYAIFDAAKELKSFDTSNMFSDSVIAKVTSQVKVRAFLINISTILFALGCVFLWLWCFSFRNFHRAEKVFIEEEKLRNIR
ncbi:hypothetical protein J7S78_13740 [Klebsiella oxytoca]|uniref:Uncharacterized protein n=1 Tax=Klebsiella oxytoca TaxID=571 RepID=A0AAP2BIY1_KLEOX|nr:hypothetical protein [Klebsiella oxytoca]MBQ0600855.1 hypothetical protein [Klebsiella oxytoca]